MPDKEKVSIIGKNIKKQHIPRPPVKRIYQEVIGDRKRVSDRAMDTYCQFLESMTRQIAREAETHSRIKGRKTLVEEDLNYAIKNLLGVEFQKSNL